METSGMQSWESVGCRWHGKAWQHGGVCYVARRPRRDDGRPRETAQHAIIHYRLGRVKRPSSPQVSLVICLQMGPRPGKTDLMSSTETWKPPLKVETVYMYPAETVQTRGVRVPAEATRCSLQMTRDLPYRLPNPGQWATATANIHQRRLSFSFSFGNLEPKGKTPAKIPMSQIFVSSQKPLPPIQQKNLASTMLYDSITRRKHLHLYVHRPDSAHLLLLFPARDAI